MKIYEPKKILVPVDFSDLTPGVLRAALDIGEKWEADVTVLFVATESEHIPTVPNDFTDEESYGDYRQHFPERSRLLEGAEMILEERLRDVMRSASAGPRVRPLIAWGYPQREILRIAESGSFDLIIMATHGHRVLSRFLIGSVTEQVIRRAPCPVLAVRAKVAEKRLGQEGAGEESMTQEKNA